MKQSPWRLEGRTATLALGPLHARVDLDQPEIGLTDLTLAGQSLAPGQILGLVVPDGNRSQSRFVDAHVRGNDLIAIYTGSATPALRWQIYWRASSERFPHALAAIEAIVSVQTELLDSQPRSNVLSELPGGGGLFWHANGAGQLQLESVDLERPVLSVTADEGWSCFGIRLSHELGTYLELVHPDDFNRSVLNQLGRSGETPDRRSIMHGLFDRPLEKGVILRSRVLALFLPERPAAEAIAALKQTFADEALPLTT